MVIGCADHDRQESRSENVTAAQSLIYFIITNSYDNFPRRIRAVASALTGLFFCATVRHYFCGGQALPPQVEHAEVHAPR
jgi:hypothetical protein